MAEPSEPDLRLAEAMIFASAEPVKPSALVAALSEEADISAVIASLSARYAGRGVELVQLGGGWLFRTAPELAQKLTRVIQTPRRLPRAAAGRAPGGQRRRHLHPGTRPVRCTAAAAAQQRV